MRWIICGNKLEVPAELIIYFDLIMNSNRVNNYFNLITNSIQLQLQFNYNGISNSY